MYYFYLFIYILSLFISFYNLKSSYQHFYLELLTAFHVCHPLSMSTHRANYSNSVHLIYVFYFLRSS